MPEINPHVIYEIIGFLASLFVLISFLMKDVKIIRIINIIGAVLFVVYGILTKTWATVTMNFFLIFVHAFYIMKMYYKKKYNDKDGNYNYENDIKG